MRCFGAARGWSTRTLKSMRTHRYDAIDALRGFALVWMTLFHFCYDLNDFGYLHQDLHNDTFWTLQRTVILSTFLFCAGMGQAVALHTGQSWKRFWRRLAQIAGCAVLVSAATWPMFHDSFIYFGVLHGMVIMLVIARLTASWGRALWIAGLLAIVMGELGPHLAWLHWTNLLNSRWLNWLGFITQKPITEDYVPIFPWLGLMLWGLATGKWLLQQPVFRAYKPGRPGRWFAALGRRSLTYYMIHQPVLFGGLLLLEWITQRNT